MVVEEDVRQALAPVLAEQRVGKEAEKVEDELGQVVAARAALPLGVQQLDDGQRVEEVDVVVGHDRLEGGGLRADGGRVGHYTYTRGIGKGEKKGARLRTMTGREPPDQQID